MARIRQEDVEAVKERTDIVQLVGQYLTLRKSGHDSLTGLCPFHQEKTGSFSVSPAKRFDIGKYAPSQMRQVTFDTPGVVELFCDIDPSMAGFVFVLPHRVFTRPDASGAFTLPKLPRGNYILKAWHPSLGRLSRKVEMPKKGDLVVTLHF